MPSLLKVQQTVMHSLAYGDDAGAATLLRANGIDPGELLGIYRNTLRGTLVGALRLTFPAVQRLVGEEFFEGAARLFIEERLPASAYLDEYGAEFGDFLGRLPAASSLTYLPEVATLEWAVSRALHAPAVPAHD
ncbi:MAG: DNA-binding domain-containing protein, partial [Hyphomicrobium sp.]|nr:DNA-binding domain-containing protein [Hyphomicrobium sp.]